MTIPLVFSDIDGTLLDAQHRLRPAVIRAVRDYTAAGGRFCLASARPPQAMAAIATTLAVTLPLVALNGALIATHHPDGTTTPLFSQPLATGVAQAVLDRVTARGLAISVNVFAGPDWIAAPSPWVAQEAAITGTAPTAGDVAGFLATGRPVHKLLCMGEPAAVDALRDAVQGLPLTAARSKPTYLELTHPAVSKAQALRFLAGHYGLSLAQTMALGDGDNDIPMLEAAGVGVALHNASAGLLAIADHVVPANTAAGAAVAIRRFAM
ncbi:Cof-type HAD-IIB family hydrolase [Lacticaseibacillus parakribbianus]|uniref:Cof-type HAD-IIB family hydrolase n=1 Tax=Lacticaseibacillus parakribbianus TaxID=2970927 RepID=UPI0021CAF2A0|nr:Cof-type HAD-IIB family hydrolase [Lacticaseibacillus parakribbianus]